MRIGTKFFFAIATFFAALPLSQAEQVEDHPEMYSVKESFLKSSASLREHRQKMVEKRATAHLNQLSPVMDSWAAASTITIHFRVNISDEIEVQRLRFRLDESPWWETAVISKASRWHSFTVEQAPVGERNLLVHLDGLWHKNLEPILLGASFLQSEAILPLKISQDQREVAVNIDAIKDGWFKPDLSLKLSQITEFQ